MKFTKKFASVLLTLVMVLAMATTAFAAVEAGDGAQNGAYYKAKAHGADADGQGITSAIHNASEQVTTVFISTKPVLTVGRLQLVS